MSGDPGAPAAPAAGGPTGGLDPRMLAILACPGADHAPLEVQRDADGATVLVCTACRSRFPVRDGIPVLLADDAVPGPRGLGVPVT